MAFVVSLASSDSELPPHLQWLDGEGSGGGSYDYDDDYPCKLPHGGHNSSAGRQALPLNDGRPHASNSQRNMTFGFALDYDKTHQWHASPQGQNIETKAFAYGLCRWVRTAAQFGDIVLVHNRKPSAEQWLLRRLKQLAPDRLTLFRVDPYEDPLYMNLVGAPNALHGGAAAPRNSPHSLRFFILSNMLASGDFICDYCLLTDATDVRALSDPFEVMASRRDGMSISSASGTGKVSEEATLFFGDERRWDWTLGWLKGQMVSCFDIDVEDALYPEGFIYNCGLVGAKGPAFHEFIDSAARMLEFALSPVCDMAVVNLVGLVAHNGKTLLLHSLQKLKPPVHTPIQAKRRQAMLKAVAAVHQTAVAHGPPFNCPFRMIGLPRTRGECAMAHKECRYASCGIFGINITNSSEHP